MINGNGEVNGHDINDLPEKIKGRKIISITRIKNNSK